MSGLHGSNSCDVGASLPRMRPADLGQNCKGLPCIRGVAAWRDAELSEETARQGTLIIEACDPRDFRECLAAADQPARQRNSPLENIRVWRQPQLARKPPK